MNGYGLDTSVVLRLLVGVPQEQADRALDFIEGCYAHQIQVYVSDLVVLEAYHALRHHYQVPVQEASECLLDFLASEMITPTGFALAVLREYRGLGPGLADRFIRRDYLDHASQVLTLDRKFSQLPEVKRL